MDNLYFTINILWAAVFFLAAIGLAVYLGRELSGRGRILLVVVAVLVGVGVGFAMMTQYWFDRGQMGDRPIVRNLPAIQQWREVEAPVTEKDDRRVDQVCRTVMKTIGPVQVAVGDAQPVLDTIGYRVGILKAVATHPYRQNSATAVYVLPPQPIEEPIEGEVDPDDVVDLAESRLYFDLTGPQWQLVRVYRKVLIDGELVDVPIWDQSVPAW